MRQYYYESEVLSKLMERDGLNIPSSVPPYESEIKAYLINQVKPCYPKLTDYESEWLVYNYTEHVPADFPIVSVSNVTSATFENVVPLAYQSAILKGDTKYRDIDTGEILDTFDETKNLELVSVKMPVLTTSKEDDTKTITLTVNEDVTLRGIRDVRDELNCLTGEVIQRVVEIVFDGDENWIGSTVGSSGTFMRFYTNVKDANLKEQGTDILCDRFTCITHNNWNTEIEGIHSKNTSIHFNIPTSKLDSNDVSGFKKWLSSNPVTVCYLLATESIKTVDLTTVNENGESVSFLPLEGTMNVHSSGEIIQPTFDMSVPVEAIAQNLASFIDLEMEE